MGFNRKVSPEDIQFYLEVLEDKENTFKLEANLVKSLKKLEYPPELPEMIVVALKGFMCDYDEEESKTLADRYTLLKTKLYFYHDDVEGFDKELTKQELDLISEAIEFWESPDIFDGIKGLSSIEDSLENLSPDMQEYIQNAIDKKKIKLEEKKRKATIGKAKLILLKQQKAVDSMLEDL